MQLRDKTAPAKSRYLQTWWMAACMAGLLALSGCATYQVTVPDSNPIRVEGQTGGYQSKTMHAFFWGLLLHPEVLSAECYGQGINDVLVVRTWLHDYVGVVTLGLWMPIYVRFRCKAPPTRPGGSTVPRKRSRGIS